MYKNYYSLPAAAAVSGLFRELIITNPNPSLSLRWMVTSLGCRFWLATVSGGEEPVVDGAEFWKGAELLQNILELKSLLGELCWVDPGLRPFSGQGSPEDNRARMKINMVIYILDSNWLIIAFIVQSNISLLRPQNWIFQEFMSLQSKQEH